MYHSTITEDLTKVITDFSYLNTLDSEDFIIPEAAKLKFELNYQPVTSRDYRFEMIFNDNIDWEQIVDEENNTELGELYDDLCEEQGHKIGGYPFLHRQIQENGKRNTSNMIYYCCKLIQTIH